MDEVEEGAGRDAVMVHQPAQGRAVPAEIVLLQPLGLRRVDLQQVADEGADALVDLVEQVARGRVERVVEIEDPAVDVVHGIAPDPKGSRGDAETRRKGRSPRLRVTTILS